MALARAAQILATVCNRLLKPAAPFPLKAFLDARKMEAAFKEAESMKPHFEVRFDVVCFAFVLCVSWLSRPPPSRNFRGRGSLERRAR